MQGLVRITHDVALLLCDALLNETRHQLVRDLLPGVISQPTRPCHVLGGLARCCRLPIHLRIRRLVTAVDVADQRRLRHVRMPRGKSSGGRTAHRMAGDIGLGNTQVLQEGVHIRHQMAQGIVFFAGRRGGKPMATGVIGDDPIARRQEWNLMVPQVDAGAIAMRQDHGEAFSRGLVTEIDSIDVCNWHNFSLEVYERGIRISRGLIRLAPSTIERPEARPGRPGTHRRCCGRCGRGRSSLRLPARRRGTAVAWCHRRFRTPPPPTY